MNKHHLEVYRSSNYIKMKFTRKEFIQTVLVSLFSYGLNKLDFKSNSIGVTDDRINNSNLRSITYNVFNGCIGYLGINGKELTQNARSAILSSARELGQIPIRIMLELDLYRPDLINFSESADESTVERMAQYGNYSYVFFPGAKNGKGHFPGCILTKYKVLRSVTRPFVNQNRNTEDLFTRHWGKALIETPSGKVISVHSAHLWPFKRIPEDTEIRLREIEELMSSLEFDLKNEADSILLQGDLNFSPDMEEYKIIDSIDFLTDTYVRGGKENGFGFTSDSIVPSKRIDYIFAGGDLANSVLDSKVLFQGNFRLNNNDPFSFALSDHLPVMSDFVF